MKTLPIYRNLPNEEKVGQGGTYVLSGLDIYVIVDPITLPWWRQVATMKGNR
jgi:hypothetical protein